MNDLEQLLQRTLVRHAEEAPPSGQLLYRLQARAHRRQRRQLTALACGLTVVLGMVVVGVQRWPGGQTPAAVGYQQADTPVLPTPTATSIEPSPSPSAEVPSPITLALRPGPPTVDAFPLEPTRGLPGLHQTVLLSAGVPMISYGGPTDDAWWVTVSVGAAEPKVSVSAAQTFQVRGRTVRYVPRQSSGDDEWLLWWPERAGQWVTVRGAEAISVNHLLAYVAGVTRGSAPVVQPFTFRHVPANLTVDNVVPSMVTFRPVDVPPGAGTEFKLTVLLDERLAATPGRTVQVGQLRGVLRRERDYTILSVQQPDQRAVTIQVPPNITVTEPDLLRFAAGIRTTPAAVAGKG